MDIIKKVIVFIVFISLITPTAIYANIVLWDTSHGVLDIGMVPDDSDSYQPSGMYSQMVQLLASNSYTANTTSTGFTGSNLVTTDIAVVCAASAISNSYTQSEIDDLVAFVNDGGSLLIMSGNASSNINDNINYFEDAFGIGLASTGDDSISFTYSSNLAEHEIFEDFEPGDSIYMQSGGELFVSGSAAALAWESGTNNIMVASSEYGQGKVLVVGDFNMWANNNILIAENEKFCLNTFEYLAPVPEPVTLILLTLGGIFLKNKH